MSTRPFNLEAFKKGERAWTKESHEIVEFLAINPKAIHCPLLVTTKEGDVWLYKLDGTTVAGQNNYNLEMVPKIRKFWMNLYPYSAYLYESQEYADTHACHDKRIGPARLVEIEE